MPDIAMCSNADCEKRFQCYRHSASGAVKFSQAIPLDKLEREIVKFHDDHGEFDYAGCAAHLKEWFKSHSMKLLDSNCDWYSNKDETV